MTTVDAVQALGLLGGGRQAAETLGYLAERGVAVAWMYEDAGLEAHDHSAGMPVPIIHQIDDEAQTAVSAAVTAVGDPKVRQRLAAVWGDRPIGEVVSERAWIAADARVGVGCTIAPFAAINRCVRIGDHVLVNVGAILSHDVIIEEFCTLSPGCRLAGGVTIGAGTFIGIGATISDRVTVGAGSFVAAGAVVVDDVAPGTLVMGVPARPRQASA